MLFGSRNELQGSSAVEFLAIGAVVSLKITGSSSGGGFLRSSFSLGSWHPSVHDTGKFQSKVGILEKSTFCDPLERQKNTQQHKDFRRLFWLIVTDHAKLV